MHRATSTYIFLYSSLSLLLPFIFLADGLAQSTDKTPIAFGFVLPLTGEASDYGVAVKNGFQLGLRRSGLGKDKLNLVFEDSPYSSAGAVTAFKSLTDFSRVDAVVPWGVVFCSVLGAQAEAKKIPLLGVCVSEQASRGHPHVIRFMNGASEYMEALAHVLREEEIKCVAVVATDQSYDTELLAAFKRAYGKDVDSEKIEMLAEHSATDVDFRSTIDRIIRSKSEAVVALLGVGKLSLFVRQLRERRFSGRVFGSNTCESKSERDVSPAAFEQIYFINESISPAFRELYQNSYGSENQISFAGAAFELGQMTGKILKQCPDCNGERLLQAYREIREWNGQATGSGKFLNTLEGGQHWKYPLVLKQILNGKIVELRAAEKK